MEVSEKSTVFDISYDPATGIIFKSSRVELVDNAGNVVGLVSNNHREPITPLTATSNGDVVSYVDTDVSQEIAEVQNIARAMWTDEVRATYRANNPLPVERGA